MGYGFHTFIFLDARRVVLGISGGTRENLPPESEQNQSAVPQVAPVDVA